MVQVKDELRKSEEKFRMISTAARDAIMITDENGKITYWNPAAEQMFGFSAQEAVEADLLSLILPVRERDHLRRSITQYDTGVTSVDELIEVLALKKDGSKVPVELSVSVGSLEGRRSAILLIRDITKPRQAREALRQSEERYRSLYSAMSEGVAIHEIIYDQRGQASDYTLLDVNPAFESITGLKKEAVQGQNASKLYGVDRAPYLEVYAEVAATSVPTCFETYFPPMGKHFNISVFSLGDRRFATVFEDISGRKQADEVLKESEERFRVLFEHAPDPFYISDMDGTLVDGNQAAEKLIGYQKNELIGENIFETGIISDADLPKALSLYEKSRNGAQTGSDEFMLYRKDGEAVYAEVSMHPVTIRGEKFMLGSARDITERRTAEQERRSWRPSCARPRKWRPSVPLPAALPMISTTFYRPL